MIREDFYYKSADNNTKIHAVKWIPEKNIKAIIQISHGVTEHILRYEEFAKYMTELGILVVGNDHLGHGTSLGYKMYFGPKGSWNYIVEDIENCRKIISEEYRGIPYYMLGFSLGSFALRTYLIDYKTKLNGVIIAGTGYNSKIETALASYIANSESKKYGEKNTTDKIKSLTFDTYNKKFKPTKTDYDWLSLSEKNLAEYIKDPLRGDAMTAGLFRELLFGIAYTCKKENIAKTPQNIPILFLSGDKDPVGKQTKGVIKVYRRFQAANIENISLKFYENLRHDILHEDNKLEIYDFIYNWLKEKTNLM